MIPFKEYFRLFTIVVLVGTLMASALIAIVMECMA